MGHPRWGQHAVKKARVEINTHLLPKQLQQLINVLGQDAALHLVEHRGGVPLIVPKRVSTDHALCELLGPQAFAALVNEYGGIRIELPKNDAVLQQLRHQRVRQLRLDGYSIDQIALKTKYSRRWVISILGAELDELAQLGLFDDDEKTMLADAHVAAEEMNSAHDPFGLALATRK